MAKVLAPIIRYELWNLCGLIVELDVTVGLIMGKDDVTIECIITALMFGIAHKDVQSETQTIAINSVAVEPLISP